MNWDALGAIGELVGATAVLVTLIYLAVQVRQARKMQLAESIRATRAERREFFTSLRDSPFIPDIFEKLSQGHELSHSEDYRLTAHHAVNWGQIYSAWLQEELDLSGGYNTSLGANFRYAWGVPGSADWMDEHGKILFSEEFVVEAMKFSDQPMDSFSASDDVQQEKA